MKKTLFILFFGIIECAYSQNPFINKCLGNWAGTMYIYSGGVVKDSVLVKFTATKTQDPKAWTWKTEYISAKMPMTKDYVLREKDKEKNIYVIDEGGGLELNNYIVGNKMYCVFEVQGIMLTSCNEIVGDTMIFEVTSGKKQEQTHKEVINYSVGNVQRVVFRKIN